MAGPSGGSAGGVCRAHGGHVELGQGVGHGQMVEALTCKVSSLAVFQRAAGSHRRFLSGALAPSRMVSILVTSTSLPCSSAHPQRLTHTSVFLFSTPVCPFFVFLPSEGKLCQHSALLTIGSHLLVTKGYRKKKNDPPLTTLLLAAICHGEK